MLHVNVSSMGTGCSYKKTLCDVLYKQIVKMC